MEFFMAPEPMISTTGMEFCVNLGCISIGQEKSVLELTPERQSSKHYGQNTEQALNKDCAGLQQNLTASNQVHLHFACGDGGAEDLASATFLNWADVVGVY